MRVAILHNFNKPNPDYQNMASGLRVRGHTVWLGTPSEETNAYRWHDGNRVVEVHPGETRKIEKAGPANLLGALRKRLVSFAFIMRLRRAIRRLQSDLVQVDPGSFMHIWLLPLLMPKETRFIFNIKQINVGVHRGFLSKIRDWNLVIIWWICCRFIYDHALFDHALSAEKILGKKWKNWATVVPVGIHPGFLEINHPGSFTSRSDGCVRFIYLGALSRFRNLEQLIVAVQQTALTTRSFEVVLVGPDMSEGFYQNLVNELGLTELIVMKPPVPNSEIPRLLGEYDVGIAYVPKRPTWDYQPTIKVLEYRAIGLPILSTDVFSHREIVKQGVNGLLTDDSPDGLSQGMLRFIQDSSFLQHCKQNARNMRQGVTIDEVAKLHENLYLKIRRHYHSCSKQSQETFVSPASH